MAGGLMLVVRCPMSLGFLRRVDTAGGSMIVALSWVALLAPSRDFFGFLGSLVTCIYV